MAVEISLRRSAVLLALASGIEYGLQLALPIVLVRFVDAHTFAQYRFLWLLASTALAIAPAFMPQSLFYFLPRTGSAEKPLFIGNVLVYLTAVACLVIVVVSGWNPLLPRLARDMFFETYSLSAVFVALWVIASMLDVLPTADGQARWQARTTIGLALLRAALLFSAACLTARVEWIVGALVTMAVAKIALLLFYIRMHGGNGKLTWRMSALKDQLLYATPFAIGNALFLLRIQADEWVVVAMLPPEDYATFAIAGVVLPIATLIRQPLYNAMMPRLNKAYANNNFGEIARLVGRTNGVTALVLLPLAGGILAAAAPIVEIVYTKRYLGSVPAMQIYLLGMMANAFAVGHVLPALDARRFAVFNSALCLPIAVVISVIGVKFWGIKGAALGSVATLALNELLNLRVVARKLGVGIGKLLKWDMYSSSIFATFVATVGTLMLARTTLENAFLLLVEKGVIYVLLFIPCFMLSGGRKHLKLLTGAY